MPIAFALMEVRKLKPVEGAAAMSKKATEITDISEQIRLLHEAVTDVVAVMNSPQRDEAMVQAAGIPLDRALFPLLVTVGRRGPIGVMDLADRIGRDHTTVSRQIARLGDLGLIERRDNPTDRRSRDVVITEKGKAMTDLVDAARNQIGRTLFATWPEEDLSQLVRLLRKLADAMLEGPMEQK